MGDNMTKINSEWIRYPVCGNKTRLQIREDTELGYIRNIIFAACEREVF